LEEPKKLNNGGVGRVLEWLESVVPAEGINIDQVEIAADSVITVIGYGTDEKTIADFYSNIRNNENVIATLVSGAESEPVGETEIMGFSITITYAFAEN
ncbi:MAG: hypothetical protein IKY44_02980, partial [Clostridia bacterium]|nr:hypothetical protein [Clostridia bacterium]